MKISTLLALSLVVALAAAKPAEADVLYVQAPDFAFAIASQYDSSPGGLGHYATTFDNFTLTSASSINTVKWTGGFFNPEAVAPITSFNISFYADYAGTPGALLSSHDIAGNGNQTPAGSPGANSLPFSYSDAVPFAAAANTQYWMSIVATVPYPPEWGWVTSSGTGDTSGDHHGYQTYMGVSSQTANDLAFELDGTPATVTPEPESLVLLATGAIALIQACRRRRVER